MSFLFLLSCSQTASYYEVGETREGLESGLYKKFDSENNLVSEVYYEDGKKNGMAISFDRTGKKYIECVYHNDTLIGDFKMYFSDGQLNLFKQRDSLGRPHGFTKVWFASGDLRQIGESWNGKRINVWKEYYENGELKEVISYDSTGRLYGLQFNLSIDGDTIKVEKL